MCACFCLYTCTRFIGVAFTRRRRRLFLTVFSKTKQSLVLEGSFHFALLCYLCRPSSLTFWHRLCLSIRFPSLSLSHAHHAHSLFNPYSTTTTDNTFQLSNTFLPLIFVFFFLLLLLFPLSPPFSLFRQSSSSLEVAITSNTRTW